MISERFDDRYDPVEDDEPCEDFDRFYDDLPGPGRGEAPVDVEDFLPGAERPLGHTFMTIQGRLF